MYDWIYMSVLCTLTVKVNKKWITTRKGLRNKTFRTKFNGVRLLVKHAVTSIIDFENRQRLRTCWATTGRLVSTIFYFLRESRFSFRLADDEEGDDLATLCNYYYLLIQDAYNNNNIIFIYTTQYIYNCM